jgi:hypothetical protein
MTNNHGIYSGNYTSQQVHELRDCLLPFFVIVVIVVPFYYSAAAVVVAVAVAFDSLFRLAF